MWVTLVLSVQNQPAYNQSSAYWRFLRFQT